MLLLEHLIRSTEGIYALTLLFKMDDEICSGHFTRIKEGFAAGNLVNFDKLKRDYMIYVDYDSSFMVEAVKYGTEKLGLDNDSEKDNEVFNLLFWDEMLHHMAAFVSDEIDAKDYLVGEMDSEIIYCLSVGDDFFKEYLVRDGANFTPLVMYEDKVEIHD